MLKRAISLLLVYGLGTALLMPFVGGDSGMSPILSAWAAHNCDADSDGYDKNNRKCGGDDTDDSDPCVPDDTAAACDTGSGGLGSAIPLDCVLAASWGDGKADTIKNDKLGPYQDAVDKVSCEIGGPSIPWPVRLVVGSGNGPWANVRQVDIDLGPFELGGFTGLEGAPGYEWLGDSSQLEDLYPSIFEPAQANPDNSALPDMDDMDTLGLQVRPYRFTQTTESIHLLPAGEVYKMGLNFAIQKMAIDRFRISIASLWYEGNESFTGIGCETGHESEILANSPGGPMKDVSIYLWPDSDSDGLPDAYTVTTGTFATNANNDVIFENDEPKVTVGSRYAAVCSAVGPLVCGNPKAPSNCNFLGYVPVTFTMTAKMR